jgi:DNA (cytosine-5)-methyltransferase 1
VNVGSLFSGIGGFDLGFQRAGMRVSWQVELDPYCRAVLARHFPEALRFADVREVGADRLDPVDVSSFSSWNWMERRCPALT